MANTALKAPNFQHEKQESIGDGADLIDHREELKGSRRMHLQPFEASLYEHATAIGNPLTNNGTGQSRFGSGNGTFDATPDTQRIEQAIQGISRFAGYALFAIALTAIVSLPFILA